VLEEIRFRIKRIFTIINAAFEDAVWHSVNISNMFPHQSWIFVGKMALGARVSDAFVNEFVFVVASVAFELFFTQVALESVASVQHSVKVYSVRWDHGVTNFALDTFLQ
jgi:hypothetical protein